jgi:hypothetical protein
MASWHDLHGQGGRGRSLDLDGGDDARDRCDMWITLPSLPCEHESEGEQVAG